MTNYEIQKMSGVRRSEAKPSPAVVEAAGLTIRRLGAADRPTVLRLAELDSKDVPDGDLLGAEIEGRLVAVAPIAGGETIADPFSRTGELRALLELRAAQVRDRQPRRSRLGGLLSRRSHRGTPTAPTPPGHPGLLQG